MYNASRPDFGILESKERYYEHDVSVETRLSWVEMFSPGSVIGAELRDAVGLKSTKLRERSHMLPWFDGGNAEGSFGGMLFWGYPPGWVSITGKTSVVIALLSLYETLDFGRPPN